MELNLKLCEILEIELDFPCGHKGQLIRSQKIVFKYILQKTKILFLIHFSVLLLRKDRASKWWNNYWALFLVWLFHFCGNLGGTIRGKLLFNYLLVSPILKFSVSTVSHPEQLLNRYLNRGLPWSFCLKTNPLFS